MTAEGEGERRDRREVEGEGIVAKRAGKIMERDSISICWYMLPPYSSTPYSGIARAGWALRGTRL